MLKNCMYIILTLITTWGPCPNFVNSQENLSADKFTPGELIIKIKAGVDSLSLQSSLDNLELTKLASASRGNWILVGFDKNTDVLTKVNAVKNSLIAEWAQPNYIYQLCTIPNDTHFDSLWSLHNVGQQTYNNISTTDADIDASEAWDTTQGVSNLKIGILDTGIPLDSSKMFSHSDLDDTNKFIWKWDCVTRDTCATVDSIPFNILNDFNGHGTLTSGIVAAEANNNIGITGVIWNCSFNVIKAANNTGNTTGWKLTNSIHRAVDDGIKIISISLRGYPGSDSTYGDNNMESAIAHAESNQVVISAAVGNEGPDTIIGFPAAFATWGTDPNHLTGYANVIAVGGTKANDALYSRSNVSNSTKKITVTAPAQFIFSTRLSSYAWAEGTSMAAPHVAGVAGLLRSKYPDSSAAWMRQVLESTSDKVWQDPAKAGYANNDTIYHNWHRIYGFGRVNAFRAVTLKTLKAPSLDSSIVLRDTKDSTHWIKLFWTDISVDEDSFKIYRAKFSTPYQFSKVASAAKNQTTYLDPDANLIGSETYIYRVRSHENISNSGNFSFSDTIKNIPKAPLQNNPSVIYDFDFCCSGSGMAPCGDARTEKVIVKWNPPDSTQLAGKLTHYKIKAKRGTSIMWFGNTPANQYQDTVCLWPSGTCSLWVYAYDNAGDSSHASNKKTVTTGGCQICGEPPPEQKVLPLSDLQNAVNLPKEFSLAQNYPNPFNLTTQIKYALPQDADVQITIYNILGRNIKNFKLGHQASGYKTVTWDGKDNSGNEVGSGIYFYRIVVGDFSETRKMTLLK